MNSCAITNHGNMNSFPHWFLYSKKLKEEKNIDFKPIYGMEGYYIESIQEWKKLKETLKEEKKQAKAAEKELKKKLKEEKETNDEVELVVEDEQETKSKTRNPLNERRHLVLLAQNQIGLKNLFKLISLSYQGDNFYKFPRIDLEMLKKYNEGLIVSSACLGGILAKSYWTEQENGLDAIKRAMKETALKFIDIFGDRFYGELQWNAFKEQHIVNKLIIELSQELNFKLISTNDFHYPKPDLWKDRILYKKIGWLNKKDEKKELPSSLEEVGCELYPKNGNQVWEAYKKYSAINNEVYDDKVILGSIEETYNIATNRIENYKPDTAIKLPKFIIPENTTADEELTRQAFEGLKLKKLDNKEEYKQQLNKELSVIKENKFSEYFLMMKAVFNKANEVMLIGTGRGSGAGSLVSYVLGLTRYRSFKMELIF